MNWKKNPKTFSRFSRLADLADFIKKMKRGTSTVSWWIRDHGLYFLSFSHFDSWQEIQFILMSWYLCCYKTSVLFPKNLCNRSRSCCYFLQLFQLSHKFCFLCLYFISPVFSCHSILFSPTLKDQFSPGHD